MMLSFSLFPFPLFLCLLAQFHIPLLSRQDGGEKEDRAEFNLIYTIQVERVPIVPVRYDTEYCKYSFFFLSSTARCICHDGQIEITSLLAYTNNHTDQVDRSTYSRQHTEVKDPSFPLGMFPRREIHTTVDLCNQGFLAHTTERHNDKQKGTSFARSGLSFSRTFFFLLAPPLVLISVGRILVLPLLLHPHSSLQTNNYFLRRYPSLYDIP